MRKNECEHWADRLGELDQESLTLFDKGYVIRIYRGHRLTELRTSQDAVDYIEKLTGKKEVSHMAKFNILDQETTESLINRKRGTKGPIVDLTEYVSFLGQMQYNQAGSVEPEAGESARAVRRRLTAAAKLAGVAIRQYRSVGGETAIRFSVHELPVIDPDAPVAEPKTRKARTPKVATEATAEAPTEATPSDNGVAPEAELVGATA